MKRKQPFWVRLFSPVKLKTQRIDKAGSHPRVRLAAFNVFVGVGSFLVAFFLGSFLMTPGDSSAEDSATLANDATLSIALTPQIVALNAIPSPDGNLTSGNLNIQTATNNTTGYTLSVALSGTETALKDTIGKNEIPSTTATIRNPMALSVNTWGWYPGSLANNTDNLFAALPSSSNPYTLKETDSATQESGETTTISVGVNIDMSLPSGSYSNEMVITAVTNYVPQPILDVYPTTGWVGDTITLYSNGGFVNVQSVTVGNRGCSFSVKSADELTCILPPNTETDPDSGTDNGYEIRVFASNTELDSHNFTIRYFNPTRTETASVSSTKISHTNMSSFTSQDCRSLSVGDIVSLTDERNGQTYRIKKMQDNKCWMVDNMKYKGEEITISNVDGTSGIIYNGTDGRRNTVDGTTSQSSSNFDKAFYNNPMFSASCYFSDPSSYTKCGYLYNWYAATAGTGNYAINTEGTNVSGSICPAGWRLPSSTSDESTATGNGTSYTAADYPVLNASMEAGSLAPGSASNYGTKNWTSDWFAINAGVWYSSYQSSTGNYWSSTASYNPLYARFLRFAQLNNVSVASLDNKDAGRSVRCVMEVPPEEIYIEDIYPTTGWGGNTIKITLNQRPSAGVDSVTVGGTPCTSISTSGNIISCVLPSKSASTDDGYAIDLIADDIKFDSHNFTIRFFNPSTTTSMQEFTGATCGSMSVGDIVSLTDERNGQTYRIKKMQDNKCWMVDNMKYLGEGITISNVDSTTGITYNNESGKFNTVDGTDTQSSTNFNKAFYNNPMSDSYCYGTSIQSSYTKCGYLYNWYAATAGTGTYATSKRGTNVSGSICPTGWRLPSATSDGSTATGNGTSSTAADFPVLNASMNAGSLTTGSTSSYPTGWQFTGAWSGVFSGGWGSGFSSQGSYGYYWSSTAVSFASAWSLNFGSSYVNPGNNSYSKYNGRAVRCVMEETPAIQDFTVDECQAKASDSDFTVIDIRDGNDYTVRYIEGDCWMTQNLRLAGGTTLTSSDSDVRSTYTLPTTGFSGTPPTVPVIQSEIAYSGSITTGYWYNACAVSAGNACDPDFAGGLDYSSICPAGWKIPSRSKAGLLTDPSWLSAFSPVTGGYIQNGPLYDPSNSGGWWTWNPAGQNQYFVALYTSYNNRIEIVTESDNRRFGYYVRCIRSN